MPEKPTYEELEQKVRELEQAEYERRQVEMALRESKKLQNQLLQKMDAGVLIIDVETHVIEHANRKALELFRNTEEKVEGYLCHSYICPAEKGSCPGGKYLKMISESLSFHIYAITSYAIFLSGCLRNGCCGINVYRPLLNGRNFLLCTSVMKHLFLKTGRH